MRSWFTPLFVTACFTTLFLFCYGKALFRGGQFSYRDAGHYYYPLHERVQAEWNAGRWPLWEPEENGGMPLLGNPTAAVFYPGKVVFTLLPYAWAARVYVVAHTALAFLAMMVLLRSWQTSWTGAGLGALSYSFGAPILFQHSNVIYLVGAAWLPLGFHAVDRWVRLGQRWALVELAIVLAMQTLGGDPESAYLLGLAAGGYAMGMAWSRTRRVDRRERGNEQGEMVAARRWRSWIFITFGVVLWITVTLILAARLPRLRPRGFPPVPLPWMTWVPVGVATAWGFVAIWLFSSRKRAGWRSHLGVIVLGLAGSASLAALLAAAQLMPVLEFSQDTIRTAAAGSHDIHTYSIEPFRLLELVWPNVLGVHFGNNTYWRDAFDIPGVRPELWSQSLYLGGLTLVLACAELALRRGPPWRVWLSGIVLVSLLGSLGRYASPIWAARAGIHVFQGSALSGWAQALGRLDLAMAAPIRLDGFLRDGDGGVYWWMATILPGFRQFRFPAKLFTFTALGLAALAGLGWDSLRAGGQRRGTFLFALMLMSSLALLAGVSIARPAILDAFHTTVVSSTFGPFDIDGGFQAIVRSLMQASLVSSLGLLAFRLVRTRPLWASAIVLLVMTADLAVANARYVVTVPLALMESKPAVLRAIEESERQSPSSGPFRVHRMAYWEPRLWQATASTDRTLDLVSWHRDTLYPKVGINLGVEYTHAFGVGGLADFEPFFRDFLVAIKTPEAARMLGVGIGQRVVYYPRRSLDIWNTRYFVIPGDPHGWREEYRGFASLLFGSRRIYPTRDSPRNSHVESLSREWVDRRDVQVFRNLQELPRAWVVHDVRWVESSRSARENALREILFANDPLWHDPTRRTFDPRSIAWVDIDKQAELSLFLSGQAPTPAETVNVTYPTPQRAELEASLESPGLVILSDIDYPGWNLTIDGKAAPIYRVNRMMRGAALPAGIHKLVYTYDPSSFRAGLILSIFGLVALAFLCVVCALRPLDRRVVDGTGES
jgi:hypothetical protein